MWNDENRLDITPITGDTIEEAFTKTQDNSDSIYEKLNRLRTLDSATTEPSDIDTGDYWVDTTTSTLMKKNTASEEAVLNVKISKDFTPVTTTQNIGTADKNWNALHINNTVINKNIRQNYESGMGIIDTSLLVPSDLKIKCGANKTLVLDEKVYDDLPPVPILFARTGNESPTLATFQGNIMQYTFDTVDDRIYGATEVIHKYKEGTNISAHIHWATNGTDTTDIVVKWELEYTIANGTGTLPSTVDTVFGNSVVLSGEEPIPANTPAKTHVITGLGEIPGTSIKIGSYICWTLRRIAATGTAPTNDPFALAIGFHVQQDTIGSRNLYTK